MTTLNDAQNEASTTFAGPLLILAGAGAGKTKTIIERIKNLIKNGVLPSKILAITFTNKAAQEMRDRLLKELDATPHNRPLLRDETPFVSTFHALGVHILREHAHLIGLPRHFAIFDRSDSKTIIKDILKQESIDPKQFEPGKILHIISREKGNAVSQKQYEAINDNDYVGTIVAQVWKKYDLTLHKERALDFDDLLVKTLDLLQKPEIKNYYHTIWEYIHVDEYQDTNVIQYKIANILAEKHKNICAVGDIDQNIYSWRGARLKNILDFEGDYPGTKVVLLEENYRSTKTILEAANKVIEKNVFRKDKVLKTKNEHGDPIILYEGFDEMSEAEFVASKTEGLIRGGVQPENIAVLYRANFQSRALEEAFLSYGVSYQLVGTRFFERKEIKDILSYLRLSLEPQSFSDLKRIVNTPTRGIGKVSLLKIIEGKAESLPQGTRLKYEEFQKIIARIKESAETKKVAETIKTIFELSGIEDMLNEDSHDGEERIENIKELVSIASRYEEVGLPGIEKFLTHVSLQSDQDELNTHKKDGVKLMTVHAAKGLEFDTVFITGLEEGLFPHESEIKNRVKNEDDEEERRLFYVALTRARKQIILSYAQTRTLFGNRQINVPSEFIFDIPEESMVREEGTFGLLRKPLFKIDF